MRDNFKSEISQRIDRETAYILRLSSLLPKQEAINLLKGKIGDNNTSLKLISRFLSNHGDLWEEFYRKEYWDK